MPWLSDSGLKIVAQFCACRPCSRHPHGPLKQTPATQANHIERERLEDIRRQLDDERRRLEDERRRLEDERGNRHSSAEDAYSPIDNITVPSQPMYDDDAHMDEPWSDGDTVMNEPILPTNTCDLSIEMSKITLFICPIAQFLFEDELNRKYALSEDLYIDRFEFFQTIPDSMFTESFYTDSFLPMHIQSPVFRDDSSSDTSSDSSDDAFVYNAFDDELFDDGLSALGHGTELGDPDSDQLDLDDSLEEDDGSANEDIEDLLRSEPPAFDEDPAIRNGYIRIFMSYAFGGLTHRGVKTALSTLHATISSISARYLPEEIPGLSNMARTLPTLKKRLGLNTAQYIKYYFVCDTCWKRHDPEDLYKLKSPACLVESCPGILYTVAPKNSHTYPTEEPLDEDESTLPTSEKRTPKKLFPYAPLDRALQRILLKPGKWDEFQHWRKEGDEASASLSSSAALPSAVLFPYVLLAFEPSISSSHRKKGM
jgi:hypothetical protein